jgi:hypothetical protein
LAFESKPASAQDQAFLQGTDGPTIDEYVKQWRNAKVGNAPFCGGARRRNCRHQ